MKRFLCSSIIGFSIYGGLALASPYNDVVFHCKSHVKNNFQAWKTRKLVFHIDTPSVPEKQLCGSSTEECLTAGFRDFISYSYSEDKYFNHPVLTFKYCTHLDSKNFIETRVGLIPHLDRATLSIRINGEDSHRLWTHSSIKVNHNEPLSTIALDYKGDYVTECTLVPKSLSSEKGILLSYDTNYDQEITKCK